MNAAKATLTTFTLGIVALGWVASPAGAAEEPAERSALLANLPAAVQRTVRAQPAGATIRGVARELSQEGRPVYEVEMRVNGLSRDILIAEDGTLLLTEQQVRFAELPARVKAALLKHAGGRTITLVEMVSPRGKPAYFEARIGSGKKPTEVKMDLDGRIIP